MPTLSEILATYTSQAQMSNFFTDHMGIISVKSYGAVGDGTTDDTEDLQEAIDAAVANGNLLVYLPTGTYSNTGLTGYSGLTFLGDNSSFSGTSTPTVLQWNEISTTQVTADLATLEGEYDAHIVDDALHTNVMTTQGDIIYQGASAPERLAKGTAGQVLTINTGATAPEWTTPVWQRIATTTLSEAAASVSYTSLTSYRYFRLYISALSSNAGGDNLAIQFNDDTGNNYVGKGVLCYAADTAPNLLVAASYFGPGATHPLIKNTVSTLVIVDISNIQTMYKHLALSYSDGVGDYSAFMNGSWNNNSDLITKITVKGAGHNLASGTKIEVLGMK